MVFRRATPQQVETLAGFGVDYGPYLLRSEASALIDSLNDRGGKKEDEPDDDEASRKEALIAEVEAACPVLAPLRPSILRRRRDPLASMFDPALFDEVP